MHPRKGFFIRLTASLIDAVILLVALGSLGFGLDAFLGPGVITERIADALFTAAALAYTSFDIFTAGTPGKLLLGLTIASPDATPASAGTLSLRWSTKYFPLICALLFVLTTQPLFRLIAGLSNVTIFVGCLFASCDHHLAWHDQWARTAVYRRRDLAGVHAFPATTGSSA
jgi:uncharacterized RDD family membrane protein YckC